MSPMYGVLPLCGGWVLLVNLVLEDLLFLLGMEVAGNVMLRGRIPIPCQAGHFCHDPEKRQLTECSNAEYTRALMSVLTFFARDSIIVLIMETAEPPMKSHRRPKVSESRPTSRKRHSLHTGSPQESDSYLGWYRCLR